MRGSSGPRIYVSWLMLVLAIALVPSLSPDVEGAAPSQPSTFYFHNQSSKTINNITTTLWANTTQIWSTTTQTEARAGVKGGVPAVWNFYSQPALAGNVTLTGPLTFTVFLSSSALTGSTTVITGTVSKITATGTRVPLATASLPNIPITTTVSVYSFSINSNTYFLEAGSNFEFTVTVSIPGGATRTITLYYDVPSYPSQVLLTFQSRFGVTSFASYNQTGVQTGFFSRNWTATGRQITLRAVLFDAIGLYDLAVVNTTIVSPSGSIFLTSTPLVRTQGIDTDYTGTWILNVTYSNNDPSGIYVSNLRVTDNSAQSITPQLPYTVFATWRLNLEVVTQDQTPVPVPGVAVTIFTAGNPVFSGISNSSGWVFPTGILLRDDATYLINSFWQGSLVNQTASYNPTSSLNMRLYLSVYQVDFSRVFKDGNGKPLPQPPSSFQLLSPNGSITSPTPSGVYLLPAGTYSVSGVMWKGVDVAPAGATFNPRGGNPVLNLQIYDLTILVVDQDGRAISGAKVTLELAGQVVSQGFTGSDGVLVVQSLPKGQYIVQVEQQSQNTRTTVNLDQNLGSKVQVALPSSWVGQSLGWILLLGVAVGTLVGYRQISRSRLAFKEEPFEYFNTITGGGFRSGDTVLIVGDEGTGKTTMCEQLAYKSLVKGDPTIFLTYDSPERVRESMKAFRWDPSQYEAKRQFQLVGCELSVPDGSDRSFGILENFYDITALNLSISSALGQIGNGKPIIFIDSLTQLVERASVNGLVNLVLETSVKVKKRQGQLFLTIGKSISRTVLGKLDEAADSVIELVPVAEEKKTFSEFRVKKMRGRKFDNRPLRVRVDPKKGLVFQFRRTIPRRH